MAGKFVTLVLAGLRIHRLPSGAKLVACAFADIANSAHKGVAWQSVETLAQLASVSERQARLHLRTLEHHAVLIRIGDGHGGPHRTTRYQLNLEMLEATIVGVKAEAHFRPQPGSTLPGKPGSPAHLTRKSSVANPEIDGIQPGNPLPPNSNRTVKEPLTNTTKRPPRKRSTLLPEAFGISDRVKAWAEDKGHGQLEQHLEHFVGYCRAHAKTYADWDEALMNAIRGNWAKVSGKGNRPTFESRISEQERVMASLTGRGKGRMINAEES